MKTILLPPITYRPYLFYTLVFFISGLSWFFAAYLSHQSNQSALLLPLALLGLSGPMIAAFVIAIFPGGQVLRRDYRQRLLTISTISLTRLGSIVAIILLTLLSATAISLLFDYPTQQFSFSSNFIAMLPLALLAALFEELGWRSYGVDSLLANHNLLSTSLLFAILWGLWHVPLFFINQTYQHGLYQLGPLYVVNFFVSILPATLLANWFYYHSNRSIVAAILFHFLLVASAELLQTAPQTKWILTGLLLLICAALVKLEWSFFTKK